MGSRSRVVRAGVGAVVLALAAATVPAASAGPVEGAGEHAALQELLDRVRATETAPGVGITFGDGADDGEPDVTLSSGTRRAGTRQPIESDDMVRVGSDTKMFVATVVLQLVGEGRIELDAPVDQYLPGVLRYPADKVPGDPAEVDGRTVTIRQLLQHTGGLPDYGADLGYVLNPIHQVFPPTPQQLIAHSLASGPAFRPGTAWGYSNTGYLLLGLVVETTTGRSLRTEIQKRIAEPLGLEHTFFAERKQRTLPDEHVHGYLTRAVPVDWTRFEPAVWGAAGALVSSPDDMNTFLSAVLAGELLPPAQLAAMQDDVPYLTGGYGLGLVRTPLSCGDAWGHAGFLAGYRTASFARPDGRHAFVTINSSIALQIIPPAMPATAMELLEQTLC